MLEVNADAACVGVITWMHTFSPAKMWINGLQALQKPMLHLHTQSNVELPWAEIDMDFMNLNQAAHGDREFAHVLSRGRRAAQDGRRPRVRPGGRGPRSPRGRGRRPGWPSCARSSSPASATTCARSRSPRATRSRPSCASASPSTRGASTTSSRRSTRPPTPRSTRSSPSTRSATTSSPELRRGGERHESLRYGARIELGLRAFLERRRVRRLHDELRGPRRAAPAARARRAAADGRRLRLRRRGRLEDGGDAARPEGRSPRGCPAAPRSWRTTRTTSCPATSGCSARTCSRCARRSPSATPTPGDPPAARSATARIRCG